MKKLFDRIYCDSEKSEIPIFLSYFCLQTHHAMITVKPIVITSNRRTDGTYLVVLRVYFAGKVRRLPTSIVCRSGDLTRSGKIKNQAILDAANIQAGKLLDAVSQYTEKDLAGKDVDWVVERMKYADRLHTFTLDFFAFADAYLETKNPSARCQYITALNAFSLFLGRRSIDINSITKGMITDFVSWMSGKAFSFQSGTLSQSKRTRIPNGAESRHIAKLGHIFEKAKERYNDEDEGAILIPRSPFSGIKIKPPPSKGQDPLPVKVMQRVIDARHPLRTVQNSLDLFVLSFALMGANLADLYEARRMGTVWVYRRKKVRERRADGAEMRVTIPECVKDRLPALDELRKYDARYVTDFVNRGLERWCEDEGLPRFTFGAARHTFATLARYKAGVEKATVDECLCHIGDFRVTDIYLQRDWDLLDRANKKVLALFKW